MKLSGLERVEKSSKIMATKSVTEEITEQKMVHDKKEQTIVNCWRSMRKKPKCIVFDLDYTIWPFMVDAHLLPPFRYCSNAQDIIDHRGRKIILYEDIQAIIRTLKNVCFQMDEEKRFLAIASRATALTEARQILAMFDLIDHFDSIQIYSGTKQKHFRSIKAELKLAAFTDILFFDDNKSNLAQIQTLGSTCQQVRRHYGLNLNEFCEGLRKFNSK